MIYGDPRLKEFGDGGHRDMVRSVPPTGHRAGGRALAAVNAAADS